MVNLMLYTLVRQQLTWIILIILGGFFQGIIWSIKYFKTVENCLKLWVFADSESKLQAFRHTFTAAKWFNSCCTPSLLVKLLISHWILSTVKAKIPPTKKLSFKAMNHYIWGAWTHSCWAWCSWKWVNAPDGSCFFTYLIFTFHLWKVNWI